MNNFNNFNNGIKGILPCLFLIACSACFAEELPGTNVPGTNVPGTNVSNPNVSSTDQPLIPSEIFWCDANNPSPIQSEDKRSFIRRWCDKLISVRDETSYRYMAMVYSLDNYFSGGGIEETNNGSYIKVSMQSTFYKNGEIDDGLSINAKVELPNTEKHFKLIFSSDPEEDKTLSEKIKNNASSQHVEKDSSIAGIEYTPEKAKSAWEHNFATGVKLRFDPVPFIRYQFSNHWQLDETWKSGFKQSFWNYRDDGIGATTRINFGRPLTEKDYFNAETMAEYLDRDHKYYYGETLSNTHRLTESSSIIYWTGVLAESQPDSEVTNYLIGVDYRQSLYKDWILLSVKPLLDFPREENWDATPSLTFELQIYFTE